MANNKMTGKQNCGKKNFTDEDKAFIIDEGLRNQPLILPCSVMNSLFDSLKENNKKEAD